MLRLIALATIPLALLGCSGGRHALAKQVISDTCAACHTIPGVAKAQTHVGPNLTGIARRQVIAGRLPNSRANMLLWITHAQQVSPGVDMPDIPLTPRQAEAVADYLYTLD